MTQGRLFFQTGVPRGGGPKIRAENRAKNKGKPTAHSVRPPYLWWWGLADPSTLPFTPNFKKMPDSVVVSVFQNSSTLQFISSFFCVSALPLQITTSGTPEQEGVLEADGIPHLRLAEDLPRQLRGVAEADVAARHDLRRGAADGLEVRQHRPPRQGRPGGTFCGAPVVPMGWRTMTVQRWLSGGFLNPAAI